MLQLSVVIITLNEERNIGRCLQSVKDIADDIVVIDSFSTDGTENICKEYNVNFITQKWSGYSATKNYGNDKAKFNWILSLDADEALSEELKKSIQNLKNGNTVVTCKFNRLTNYCGHWINHCGWYPDDKVRIFDKRVAQWEGLVHEKLEFSTEQKPMFIKGDCLHYSYYNVEEHYHQTEKYAILAAQKLYATGKKPSLIKKLFSPVVKFISSYFIKLGFLDGYYGFIVCKISAWSTFLKYEKLEELHKSATH